MTARSRRVNAQPQRGSGAGEAVVHVVDDPNKRGSVSMYVKDILGGKGNDVFTVRRETTVVELAKVLVGRRIGAAVVAEGDTVVGVVSERDIVHCLAEQGAGAVERAVADVMTVDVKTVTPDTTIDEVMALMTRRRIRHLPVLEDGKLTGIVSIGDVVKDRIASVEREASQLREYITA